MRAVPLVLVGLASTPALAEPMTFTPLIDARLRYEHVEQAPMTRDANAATVRVRSGFEAKTSGFSLLVDGEAVLALNGDYNSGLNGETTFPIVADPQNIELNRLQLQYRALPKTIFTVGRQRINLDDQRFVGSVGWRDSEQTFDAGRVEWAGVKNLQIDVTYVWNDRTIWGVDGGNRFGPARYQGISGDNVFANVALTTKFGKLTGFAYLVDQDEILVRSNSSQTFGFRLAGVQKLKPAMKINYAASYARQSDYHRNSNDYAADYYAADLMLDVNAFRVGGGYEVLGADKGAPLTSFQTPLATLHKFNGWADKFLATPANGLRDAYGSVGYGWKRVGPFDAVDLTAVYHRFHSDLIDQHYGNEIDAQLMLKRKGTTALIKYADYSAARFATDTRKLWLSLEWAI